MKELDRLLKIYGKLLDRQDFERVFTEYRDKKMHAKYMCLDFDWGQFHEIVELSLN